MENTGNILLGLSIVLTVNSCRLNLLNFHMSNVKRNVNGDKLYVLFNGATCVTVDNQGAIVRFTMQCSVVRYGSYGENLCPS